MSKVEEHELAKWKQHTSKYIHIYQLSQKGGKKNEPA